VGEKPIETWNLFFSPKKVISGKIYSESYYVYVNLKCRLALFRTRPNIYLSIDSRFQFLTSPSKRLIFTGVCIVKFRNLIHVSSMYTFPVFVPVLYGSCIFHIQKISDSQFTCTQKSSPLPTLTLRFPCVVLLFSQAVCTSRYHLGGGTWNPSGVPSGGTSGNT